MDLKKKTIGLNSLVVRDDDIIFSEADGEIVMVSMERGEYLGLNPIGTRLWDEIKIPRKVSDLRDGLMPHFDVSNEQCTRDVLAFLNQLAEKKAIKIIEP